MSKPTRHNSKQSLLGKKAGHASPAWREQQRRASAPQMQARGQHPHPHQQVPQQTQQQTQARQNRALAKSKILLSNLPRDVSEAEINDLFNKTIGPVVELHVVYNNAGQSKGMAVIAFARPQDGEAARQMYNGKIVDGRAPLKIDLIVDGDSAKPTSLAERLGPAPAPSLTQRVIPLKGPIPTQPKKGKAKAPSAPGAAPTTTARVAATTKSVPAGPKKRVKKGPKRVKKVTTVADLDQDMDDYKASVNGAPAEAMVAST